MSIEIDDLNSPGDTEDYQRANGAPMVLINEKRERFSRTSNFAKPLDDESALTNWRIDTAAFGVANDKTLVARYIAAKRDDRKTVGVLREDAIQAGRGGEAAAIGTAIHAMSERWEQEHDFEPPEPYLSALTAYTTEMNRLGLVSALFEFKTVNVEYRVAGTADRAYKLTKPLVVPTGEILPAGTLVIGDIKTSKSLQYSKGAFASQLSLYAQGQQYDVVHDEFMDTPEINQDWGLIAWVPSNQEQGHCEFLWIDLQAGNEVAYLAHLVKEYRKKWRKTELTVVPSPTGDLTQLGTVVEAGDDDWVGMMLPYVKARIAAIRDDPDALKQLQVFWPEECPSPKKGITDPYQLTALLDHLDKVEADHGLTFVGDDPRTTAGAHQGAGPVNNAPERAERSS
jgi:hypothetical protein